MDTFATMTTFTQSDVERHARNALADRTEVPLPDETISDAVDVYLGGVERDESRQINRGAIDRATTDRVVAAVVQVLANEPVSG